MGTMNTANKGSRLRIQDSGFRSGGRESQDCCEAKRKVASWSFGMETGMQGEIKKEEGKK